MESTNEKNKVEWEGKHITVPEPFTRVEHLLRYIVSLMGWQLQNGKNYNDYEELIRDIQSDIKIYDSELQQIFETLNLEIPVKMEDIEYCLISNSSKKIGDIDTIKSRRSIRLYSNEAIGDDDIFQVLDAARHAPSARNIQPIEYIVIRDQKTRDKLSQISRQNQPSMAPVSIVVIGDLKRAGFAGSLSIHDTTTRDKGVNFFVYMDAAAAIQNMLLASQHNGIGSLWISSFDIEGLQKMLQLPDDHIPLAIITLGKYDKTPITPPRRNLDEIVHFEEYTEKNHDPRHYNFSHLIHIRY